MSTGATVLNNDPNNPYTQTNVGPGSLQLTNDSSLLANSAPSEFNDFQQVLMAQSAAASGGIQIETVKVPFPVLVEKNNIMSRSDSAVLNSENYYGNGLITIMLNPFDNLFKFSIATGSPSAPKLFDLSGFSEIKFIIKDDKSEVSFPLFTQSGDINLSNGTVVFKVTQNRIQDIKKIYNTGVNIFYITGSSGGSTFVIYSGLFKIFDSPTSVAELNQTASKAGVSTGGSGNIDKELASSGLTQVNQEIKLDPTINSSVKDLVSRPISKETLPEKKPDFNKEIQKNIESGKYKKQ
jgi:hypothetical protein